eukprot:g5983.t1
MGDWRETIFHWKLIKTEDSYGYKGTWVGSTEPFIPKDDDFKKSENKCTVEHVVGEEGCAPEDDPNPLSEQLWFSSYDLDGASHDDPRYKLKFVYKGEEGMSDVVGLGENEFGAFVIYGQVDYEFPRPFGHMVLSRRYIPDSDGRAKGRVTLEELATWPFDRILALKIPKAWRAELKKAMSERSEKAREARIKAGRRAFERIMAKNAETKKKKGGKRKARGAASDEKGESSSSSSSLSPSPSSSSSSSSSLS